nr:hypothetical protein Iba_chr08cCG11370 [Ipomoea batatas]
MHSMASHEEPETKLNMGWYIFLITWYMTQVRLSEILLIELETPFLRGRNDRDYIFQFYVLRI